MGRKTNLRAGPGRPYSITLLQKRVSLRSPEKEPKDESKSRYERFHGFKNLGQESKTEEEHAEIEDR